MDDVPRHSRHLAALGIAVGFVFIITPGLFLLTIWSVIVPVIVLERVGVVASFGRSRALVRGYGWNVLGTVVAMGALTVAVDLALTLLFLALPTSVRGFVGDTVSGTLVTPSPRSY